MTSNSNLSCETTVLEKRTEGIILEIRFNGVHHWKHGNEMLDYIQEAIETHNPAAIVINLLEYEYIFGNDIFAPIFFALHDQKQGSIRPCSVVAVGHTAKSLESLIDASNIRTLGKINIKILKNIEAAQEEIRRHLSISS